MNTRKTSLSFVLFCIIMLITLTAGRSAAQLPWPVEATGSDHPMGNSCGEFQQYGGGPYLHTGIDIREDHAPTGPWVRSVIGGTLTLSDNASDPTYLYNGVTIFNTGTGCTYRYWHLDHNTITNDVRNAFTNSTIFPANTRISQIVDWKASNGNFHHLHFDIISGGNFINPISATTCGGALTPETDATSPEVHEILICRNNTNTFLTKPGTGCWIVDGDLDIIARASDRDPPLPAITWQANIGVYRIEYSIKELQGTGTHNVPATELYRFDTFSTAGSGSTESGIIFKNVSPANSQSNYASIGGERSYYIVTNVDAGGNLSEANGFWNTDGGGFPDGLYQITVKAYDFVGNQHTKSEIVFVKNNPSTPSPVDVVIRDRNGDSGAVPSNPNGEAFWVSPDIRVDAPPFGTENATSNPFGANSHDNPIFNQQNRVYIRVHNFGCTTSGLVRIRFYWANPSGGIPPSEWDEIQPSVIKNVNSIPSGGSVEYSPPILWTPTGTAIGHRCVLVRLESTQDPITNDYNVPGDNNIGQKNVNIVTASPGAPSADAFFIANPFKEPAEVHLTIDRRNLPQPSQFIMRLPYDPRLFKALRGLEGVNVKFNDELLEVGIWKDVVTLQGFFLYPGDKIFAEASFILADDIDIRKTYFVDVIQTVDETVTGGLRFEIPGRPDRCRYNLMGDLNGDLKVNFFDVALMASNWLTDCEKNPDDPMCMELFE